MASYTYSDSVTILSLSETLRVGDTLTFRDNTQLVVTEDNYSSSWVSWVFGNWASAINQNTVYPTNQTSSNVFDALYVAIESLNLASGQNGKCRLTTSMSHYIQGYNYPHTDVTVSFLTTDYWTVSMSKTIDYGNSNEYNLAIVQDLINFAQQKMRDSYCYKIKTTCCLEALCNPNDYILI